MVLNMQIIPPVTTKSHREANDIQMHSIILPGLLKHTAMTIIMLDPKALCLREIITVSVKYTSVLMTDYVYLGQFMDITL